MVIWAGKAIFHLSACGVEQTIYSSGRLLSLVAASNLSDAKRN